MYDPCFIRADADIDTLSDRRERSMGKLEGKTAWVTGSGRGIGKSIAMALAQEGANVALSSRSQDQLDQVAREIKALGVKALAVKADAMLLEDTLSCVKAIENELGPVDILFNNAGGFVMPREDKNLSAAEVDFYNFADNVDLNLFSVYRATQAVLPGMCERQFGRIINIGSGYAKNSGGPIPYTAAKHGLVGLTRALAAEVAGMGVTVNCLCPGWTNTALVDIPAIAAMKGVDVDTARKGIEADNLQRRILEPEELAPMACLLALPESKGITGQVISVDGGYRV